MGYIRSKKAGGGYVGSVAQQGRFPGIVPDPAAHGAGGLEQVSTAGVRIMFTLVPICFSPRSARAR